jgi:hypothetical protein
LPGVTVMLTDVFVPSGWVPCEWQPEHVRVGPWHWAQFAS